MALRPFGCLVTVQAEALSLTKLIQAVLPEFRAGTFSDVSFRAHFDNADRLFLQTEEFKVDCDYIVPGAALEVSPHSSVMSTDSFLLRAATAGDRCYVLALEE